ncbi:MAG TPA: ATP-binding protein [Ignavibacteriaceae bacterium]|nr:ATP-binding protein [Ignavibacteriaceae bacterium]
MSVRKKNRAAQLKVKSRTENLSEIRDFVSGNARAADIPEVTVENIILAVDEACTNIIKHAYNLSPEGEIIIKIDYDEEKFMVTIIDYGKSFEPDRVPLPDLQKYYREHRVGGLGMYLMKSLMDDVEYRSVPGKYNQVLLSKNIRSG